jgi:hypothetical protein
VEDSTANITTLPKSAKNDATTFGITAFCMTTFGIMTPGKLTFGLTSLSENKNGTLSIIILDTDVKIFAQCSN